MEFIWQKDQGAFILIICHFVSLKAFVSQEISLSFLCWDWNTSFPWLTNLPDRSVLPHFSLQDTVCYVFYEQNILYRDVWEISQF